MTLQAISKRVTRLEDAGVLTTRQGPGRTKLINLAQYDRAVGQTGDGIRQLNGRRVSEGDEPVATTDKVLAKGQARRAAYAADLLKLDLDERLGELRPIADVRAATVKAAEVIVRQVDRLPARAEELWMAVMKDGKEGAHAFLRTIAREWRSVAAAELQRLTIEDPAAASAGSDTSRN